MKNLSLLFFLILLNISLAVGQDKLVYTFEMQSQVDPSLWRKLSKALAEAKDKKVDMFIIHLNTYGGYVESADSIRTALLNSPFPIIAFIDKNAASAGALIALAADSIYMSSGASIGAASVVDQNGTIMPDKYQSYMRATMRATAEAHGADTLIAGTDTIIQWHRNPHIAEAMVDPRIKVAGVTDSGYVLSFTTQEAIKHGYCEGTANNMAELLEKVNMKNATVLSYNATVTDNIIGWLISPVVQGILIMIIVGGIYFELQTPGIGFPSLAAIVAALLYFAPLYVEGIAEYWEILLFIVGVILLAIEIFAIPGFGITGISGIIFMVVGLALAMVHVPFQFDVYFFGTLFKSLTLVIAVTFAALLVSIVTATQIIKTAPFSFIALNTEQPKDEGFISFDTSLANLVGKTGIAITDLRLSGKIEIDGNMYDAFSIGMYIEKGENVKIVKFENGQMYVQKYQSV